MTDALDTIARLREFAADDHEPGSAAEWLAGRLRDYLDHAAAGVTLDAVLGVAPSRDEWPWWRHEKRARVRAAAAKLVNAFGDTHAAHEGLIRYAAGRGRNASQGDVYSDQRAQAAHDYLSAAGKVPDSARTLRRALHTSDRWSPISCPSGCD
jgi:hypothetical protein